MSDRASEFFEWMSESGKMEGIVEERKEER